VKVTAEQEIPAGTTLLLKGGRVLTRRRSVRSRADIAIAADKIVGVADAYLPRGAQNEAEIVDARDFLALPGFINACLWPGRRVNDRGETQYQLASQHGAATLLATLHS